MEYQGADYGGKVQLTPRIADVSCDTITNVRVTYREIQETILLDFRVLGAGIRSVAFRLPARLKDARIVAPMIRQKSVVEVPDGDAVRVTLELQDAVTGQYRVVVEHDRSLAQRGSSRPCRWSRRAARPTGTSHWRTPVATK